MSNIKSIILLLILSMFLSLPMSAETKTGCASAGKGILSDDKKAISAAGVKAPRKKVGLVLSGGGAKGMGHIGALKVIERAGIPIDYVVGTSMGSIIGGLYSIGYSPEEMDSIVRMQDWASLLSDQTPRHSQSMAEREREKRYVLSVPLGGGVETHITGGIVKGQNVYNLLSELTVGYHDSIDFNLLPKPFACVSQDIVTGREVQFRNGYLPTAIRASMAIPGVFAPVRQDSMVLIDGGMINNYPVDLVRKMGADIVIGVDVQSRLKDASKLKGAMDILGQIIDLTGQERYLANVAETDAHIKVDVQNYSSASFSREAIDSLIIRGEEAAERQWAALMQIKRDLGAAEDPDNGRSRLYTPDGKVYVRDISFNGLDKKDEKWLLRRCSLSEDTVVSIRDIQYAVAMLCSNLGYSSATYSLPNNPDGGHNLVFDIQKKYEKRINVGLRFDSEETASVLANMTASFYHHTPQTLSITARLGKRYSAALDYDVELSPLRTIGLMYVFEYNDIDFEGEGGCRHTATFRRHKAELAFSDVWHRNVRYALGARWEYYNFDDIMHQKTAHEHYDAHDDHLFNYFAHIDYDSQDHAYFPERGLSAQLSYELYTDNFAKYDGGSPISAFKGHFGCVIPLTSRFSLLPDVYGRILTGHSTPYAKMNVLGGDVAGRYVDHQLPFAGVNGSMIMENTLFSGTLRLRQRMGENHYVTLAGSCALSSHEIKDIFDNRPIMGYSVGYALNSILGPLEATFNYDNHTEKLGFYINLGYKF